MQDAKDLAFLMHPNHRTDATEGSRTAHGQAAGCIKKAPAEAGASRGSGWEGTREEKPADASGADGKARAGLMAEHGGGELGWEPDWDGWLAEKAARRAALLDGGACPLPAQNGSSYTTIAERGRQNGESRTAFHHPKHGRTNLVRDLARSRFDYDGGDDLVHCGDPPKCGPDPCGGSEVRAEASCGAASNRDSRDQRPVAPQPQIQRVNGSAREFTSAAFVVPQDGHESAMENSFGGPGTSGPGSDLWQAAHAGLSLHTGAPRVECVFMAHALECPGLACTGWCVIHWNRDQSGSGHGLAHHIQAVLVGCVIAELAQAVGVAHCEGEMSATAGHASALCLCGLGWSHLPDQLGRQVLACNGSEHTIRNTARQLVRPLVHSLVGDAHRLGGCCDGTAEKFNGFLLEHAELNHGSYEKATMVHPAAGIICNYG